MRTGEDVKELGLYMSSCCNQEMIFGRNDVFTRCPACQALCWWDLDEKLVSYDEFEEAECEVEVA
jgi:hypothetical protein